MKTRSTHPPIGAATDRTPRISLLRRMGIGMLALSLTAVWVFVPTVTVAAEEPTEILSAPAAAEETTEILSAPAEETVESAPAIARSMDIPEAPAAASIPAETSYRPLYPYPAGAMAVTLYKDGTTVLSGHVADIGGTVYVPVQRFADLFGHFRTTYVEATEEVVITGANLTIAVKAGDPYITVNDRIFYTGVRVLSLGGWIFVPLTAMCKALNARVTIRKGYYDAFITSGDPTGVARASEVYDSTDLYWLSRIISAEAKGESLEGQIAVGSVVMNRTRSSGFPNSVKDVVFDTKHGIQFAPAANGAVYQTPTPSAIRAAKICLEGYSLSSKILYFFNPRLSPSNWISQNRPYIMTIGNHKFYG